MQRPRERTRPVLLAGGARPFAARGIGLVSAAELIAEADVPRAAFYGLFSSKYSPLERILNPIFERADLRNGSAQYSLKVIARTAVQWLRIHDGHTAAAAPFRDAVRGRLRLRAL